MKSCPFCAEEIRDEAIKCRFCGSFLPAGEGGERAEGEASEAAPPDAESEKVIVSGEIAAADEAGPAAKRPIADAGAPAAKRPVADAGAPAKSESSAPPKRAGSAPAEPRQGGDEPEPDSRPRQHEVIYEGAPRWQTYLRAYVLAGLALIGLPIAGYFAASAWAADPAVTAVAVGVPLAAGAIAFALVHARRRSKRIRITSHNIEREYGFLSRRIDVLELWRCRDVRYRQSLSDRLLRIAHLELYTSDVASPHFVIQGIPSSRELFARIRDAIERERQEHRDYHRYTG